MEFPLQISFHGLAASEAVADQIRERAARLERFYKRIVSCRVVVEVPHRRHHQGRLYHVRIDLTVPGDELVISRESSEDHAHEDVHVAVRDAFDAAQRRLEDHARRQRGAVKVHAARPRARVRTVFGDAGYGFLETFDGRELYFHRDSVIGVDFDQLTVAVEVEFVEVDGDQGPQASIVELVVERADGSAL